ncbi:hypothetical protein PENSPDRAFT_752669 [Peniophora sp. CONT]|nr:hypothetical protein PENSPDRAFT_752669 [Peniophora sp. CONT]
MSEESSSSPIQTAAKTRWLDAYRALDVTLPRPTPNSSDVTRARELIDAELNGITLLLSAVKERRNELALPSLLPPEILARIFSFLSAATPINLVGNRFGPGRTLGWVLVSHVCRRWRHVCLNQPSLWTDLHTDGRHPWDMFLERAKGAPLFIEGSLKPSGLVKSILEHRHHIQRLVLGEIHPRQMFELVNGLVGPLHQLRVLELSGRAHDLPSISRPSLSTNFLTEFAPNIEHLGLMGVLFPWGEGSSSITSLHYELFPSAHTHPIPQSHTLDNVMRTLHKLPALRHLTLHNALPDGSLRPDADVIALPHLASIDLISDNDSCWYLWSRICIPSTATIRMHGKGNISAPIESLIARTLRAHLRSSPHLTYQWMSIDLSPNAESVRLSLSNLKGPHSTPDAFASIHPKIALHMFCDNGANLARLLLAEVPLEDIRKLTCGGKGIGDSQVFYDTFLPARAVTSLTLTESGAGHGLAALIPSYPSPSSGPGPYSLEELLLFPQINKVTCSAVNFAVQIQHAGMGLYVHDALSRALVERSDHPSLKLKALEIDTCDVSNEWVEGWRELVDCVEWDGQEGELAETEDGESVFGHGMDYDGYGEGSDSEDGEYWGMDIF